MKTLFRTVSCLLLASTLPLAAATIGSPAPGFELVDSNGKTHKLSDYAGKTVVLEWVNHGCPFVKKHYDSGNMQKTQSTAVADGVVWLSICSSAPGTQGNESPARWNKINAEKNVAANALLIDESGKVGRAYDARTTPHMYVIDAKGTLVYAGGIDSIATTNKSDIAKAENYVLAALADIKAGRAVATASSKPYGCNVKYAD
ncbi:MAG TPA: thioredoxin family protein [Opitutaceae bacterium]